MKGYLLLFLIAVSTQLYSNNNRLVLSTNPSNNSKANSSENLRDIPRMINGVSVPTDFPEWNVSINNDGVAAGKIFVSNISTGGKYIAILEHDGTPYFYKKLNNYSRDFKVQKNNVISMWDDIDYHKWILLDNELEPIDTITMANNVATDYHDFIVTENNHYLLQGHIFTPFDMSTVVAGGNPDALVREDVIQELDENKNLIFQWSTQNVFNYLDAVNTNLLASLIDYTHLNTIALDFDGNILLSFRHQNQILKIDRTSGEIIWRLGGAGNQFEWINENNPFTCQHDIRAVPDKPGFYTLFDNGNFSNPQISRVVEYKLDTANMTAEKVWEFYHEQNYFSERMGNAQLLENGNMFINYAITELPKACEVTPDGEVVYEADFNVDTECYRTFKFKWENVSSKPYLLHEVFADNFVLLFNKFGDQSVDKYIVYQGFNANSLSPVDTVELPYWENNTILEGEYYFGVTALSGDGNESDMSNIEFIKLDFVGIGENIVKNGTFEDSLDNWYSEISSPANGEEFVNEEGIFVYNISNAGTENQDIQLFQTNISLLNGWAYKLEFDAWADATRSMGIAVESEAHPHINYSKTSEIAIRNYPKHYEYDFVMNEESDNNSRLAFKVGKDLNNVYLDNIKLTVTGSTSVEQNEEQPEDFAVFQNYPNPFNPSTKVSFVLGKSNVVNLNVYSITGELVMSKSEYFKAGTNSFKVNLSDATSGVYIYQLGYGDKLYSGKMLLLK